MLVLLPPSEGKAEGGEGPPVDPASLTLPELAPARRAVLDELVALCSGDGDAVEKARTVLGLSVGQRTEVAKNAALRQAPTLPARERYTGVLYDALSFATLSRSARERAARSVLIFSGLWGVVGPEDAIPAYRCAGGVKLPGVGGLAAHWRGPLGEAVPQAAGEGLVLDLRSSAYTGMFKPARKSAERTASVRVLHARTVDGVEKRSVVSHFNKATKGRLVRELLESGAEPAGPGELAEALRALGYTVEAREAQAGRVRQFDVVVSEL